MPTYDFINIETGEEETKFMSISAMEEYLKLNPNIRQKVGAPNIGDSVRLGIRKHDNGFKEVLQRVHEKSPGSDLNTKADI